MPGGASVAHAGAFTDYAEFQSSPLVAGGRVSAPPTITSPQPSFNPRPSLPGGASRCFGRWVFCTQVSILAPRCRGARPGPCRARRSSSGRFNPRPSLPGGASGTPAPSAAQRCSFNPRPSLPGGASSSTRLCMARRRRFQSSPLVAGGRVALIKKRVPDRIIVSILAPRCRGARHQGDDDRYQSQAVSILAPRCRGARRWPSPASCIDKPFQSSPLVAGGRVLKIGNRWLIREPFQSSPLVAGGRVTAAASVMGSALSFQSSPLVAGGRVDNC